MARGLARMLKEIGREDCVTRGFCFKVFHEDTYYLHHRYTGPCYVFKSPRPEVDTADFLRIMKLYRPEHKDFTRAFNQVMTSKDIKSDLEMLRVMGVLERGKSS